MAGDRGEAPLHQISRPCQKLAGVAFGHAAFGQHVLLQRIEPVVEDRAEGTLVRVRGREALRETTVHGLQAVQRRLRFGNLDLCRSIPLALRPLLQPAHEEGLAAAVLAAHGLEGSAPRRHRSQLVVQRRGRTGPRPTANTLEPLARHGSAPEGVHDIASSLRTDHESALVRLLPVGHETELRIQQLAVQLDGLRCLVDGQDVVPFYVQDAPQRGDYARETEFGDPQARR